MVSRQQAFGGGIGPSQVGGRHSHYYYPVLDIGPSQVEADHSHYYYLLFVIIRIARLSILTKNTIKYMYNITVSSFLNYKYISLNC